MYLVCYISISLWCRKEIEVGVFYTEIFLYLNFFTWTERGLWFSPHKIKVGCIGSRYKMNLTSLVYEDMCRWTQDINENVNLKE